MKSTKKYRTSRMGMFCLCAGDVVALVVYICCLFVPPNTINEIPLAVISNILLVLISVLSTSIISVPLIEVRDKNELYEQMLEDVLRTPQFFDSLTKEEKENMLQTLESKMYFDSNALKENMYTNIRKKIDNSFLINEGVYLKSCEYKVHCSFEDNMIRKKILKKIVLCAYKQVDISDFPLCSMSFPKTEGEEPLTVSFLKVSGQERNVKTEITPTTDEATHPLSQKSGYTIVKKYIYKSPFTILPEKPVEIVVEYTTIVPQNDKSYICRVATPCQKFKFEFSIDGNNRSQYRVSLNAFGFIDNGRAAANPHDDTPTASIEFNDWIFPEDGVAVTILEKSLVPAHCQ